MRVWIIYRNIYKQVLVTLGEYRMRKSHCCFTTSPSLRELLV